MIHAGFCCPIHRAAGYHAVPRGAADRGLQPKLGRRVTLLDHLAFSQWVRLEADPQVLNYCERPARSAPPQSCLIDFWVRGVQGARLLVLESRCDVPLPDIEHVPVHTIALAELAAAAKWISNWSRMLPVIIATRGVRPPTLARTIVERLDQPRPLASIERGVSCGDPAVLRGTIFELLRQGQLRAPSSHIEALNLHTLLERAP